MRNIFDQYHQPENRLTHALLSSLDLDRRLLRDCLRWLLPRCKPSLLGWLVFLMIVTFVCPVSGQTLRSANLQVGQESWTSTDGAPPDIEGLAQTDDGFLWVSAATGLFRFDGMRFEPFRSPFGDLLLSTRIYSMFASRSGGLWVGYTFGGFSFVNHGRVTNYASESGSVHGFAQDRDGIVWAGTTTGLWRFDGSSWQLIGRGWTAAPGGVRQVGFDSLGILWVLVGSNGAPKDLIYLMPGTRQFKTARRNVSAEQFTWDAEQSVVTEPTASPMSDSAETSNARLPTYAVLSEDDQFIDQNNSVWVSPPDKPGIMRLPRESLRDAFNPVSPGGETYDVSPNEKAVLVDREGNIWIADDNAMHRFFYTPLIRQEVPKPAGNGFALAADENGAVWISFSRGTPTKADLYHVLNGKGERHLLRATYLFAYRAPDKTFWFSGQGCLWHLVGDEFIRIYLPQEMADQSNFLQAITEDHRGGMWVSFGRHGLYRLADGIWTPNGGRDGLKGTMLYEYTDSLGRVWFGYTNNQLVVLDGDQVRRFGTSDGLQLGNIQAIYGRGSKIWIGGDFGLTQFDHGHFHNITAVNDEFLHGISGIVETRGGDLWLNGISGIFHIRKAEIAEALKDPRYRVRGDHIGTREGLPGVADQVRPLQTAVEGTDGRLWFSLGSGVVWLDPAAYSDRPAVPAAITIQAVSADDKSYALASHLSLPAHTSSVQISYSAVSLSDPEAIRFRYQLQEADRGWHEVAAASPVTYRDLPPGSYHFNVRASDINGVWSDTIATAKFTILPAFYQTLWFRVLCAILFLAVLAGLYKYRLRQLAQHYGMRLEERVGERTRIARELHDTLLQSFQAHLLHLQLALKLLPTRPQESKQKLESAIDQAAHAIREGRDAVQDLRSSATLTSNLALALNTLGQELAVDEANHNATAPVFHFEVGGARRDLHPDVRDEVFRIAGEALRNAFRHAAAQHIEMEFRFEERQLQVRLRDDGKGIDPKILRGDGPAGHYGLRGMRERSEHLGGKFTVWSQPNAGTEVELIIPAARAYTSSPGPRWPVFARMVLRKGKDVEP
jgi:signal transduction histidine kinase/ligand-binding sensor domain-containing protein